MDEDLGCYIKCQLPQCGGRAMFLTKKLHKIHREETHELFDDSEFGKSYECRLGECQNQTFASFDQFIDHKKIVHEKLG